MFYWALYKLKHLINPRLFLFHFFSFFFVIIPLLMVIFKAFSSSSGYAVSDNFAFVNSLLIESIIRSLLVALFTLLLIFVIGYPFAYLTANIKSRSTRIVIMSMLTCPLWSSFFVKLIGLKSFFDLLYGEMSSTRGLVYVVIGLVYLNTPIAILTFYNSIIHIPRNIINASLDLGRTRLETVWKIVIPYTGKAIMSVLFLVFLPSMSCISVADFMNKSTGSKLVAQLISDLVEGGHGGIGINRLAFVILFLIYIILLFYLSFKYLFRGLKKICTTRQHV